MKPPRAGIRILVLVSLVLGTVTAAYFVLLHPRSIWVRWARAAFPARMTLITFGPYPSAKELEHFAREGGRYDVSLLDPRLPYEKTLIEREEKEADHHGLIFRDFPMASIFDHQVFNDYRQQEERAVAFLQHLNGPAYVHCYLGRHRVVHVRNALLRAGVPASYWTSTGTKSQYWDLVNRLAQARKEFRRKNYGKVLEVLKPIKTNDVDVAYLRGWSNYRLGLYTRAGDDFRSGLRAEPGNLRNLAGLGFCYLQQGEPVLAQRKFDRVLQSSPGNEEALVGRGLVLLRLKNKVAAAGVFRQALAIDPGNAEVKDYLKRAEAE